MGGFSSDTWNTDSGLNGFGGTSTSTRRFQVAYSVAGVTVSLSQNDLRYSSNDATTYGGTAGGKGYEIPRISVGYEYKDESIRAKVATSYGVIRQIKNSPDATPNPGQINTLEKHAFLLTAGVRPVFGDAYVSALLTYGLNSDLMGESKVVVPSLGEGFINSLDVSSNFPLTSTKNTALPLVGTTTKPKDTHIVALALEFGMNLTDDLGLKVGGGYQFATKTPTRFNGGGLMAGQVHSYSVFVQLPYKVGNGFNIIPQVGYLGASTIGSPFETNPYEDVDAAPNGRRASVDVGNFLATVQFALNF